MRKIAVAMAKGGVGKTTAILELLKHRPPGGKWAVLVNEFGKVPIDQAALRGAGGDGIGVAVGGVVLPVVALHGTQARTNFR